MSTLIIEHSRTSGSDRLGATLRDYGQRLQVVRLHAGDELPPDLDDVDAIVACGGSASPLEDQPATAHELALLRDAHAAALPVVGLCLGHQLLARALGGVIEKMDGLPECGWHDVRLTPAGREDPIYAGVAWTSRQLHWHRFHVAKAPDGARVLASSERTPVQAWALGLRTYGFQYHPEAWADRVAQWAGNDPDALRETGQTLETLRADTDEHAPVAARLAQRMFEAMAMVLMPVDRRYAGVAKDLHH